MDSSQRPAPYEGDALPLCYITIIESTVVCLVGSLKFLPPDPQAFQSRLGFLDSLQIMDAVLTGDYFPNSWDSPSFSHTFNNGAPRETRTLTPKYWLLRPACLPIPPSGQMLPIYRGNYSISVYFWFVYIAPVSPSRIPSTHLPQIGLSCC